MFLQNKIFCISFQRTGTTSVGEFFRKNGYSVAGYPTSRDKGWTLSWFEGDYEKIFKSFTFRKHQVFEDDPWWCLDFYKVLYHRFPKATFILFTRNPDKWYDSMMSHSKGMTLGNSTIHTKIYRREIELLRLQNNQETTLNKIDNLLVLNEDYREHYKEIYNLRNREVVEFFQRNESKRFIHLTLEDDEKWEKLAAFYKIKLVKGFKVHENSSNPKT